jgi:hypothetical protein
MGALLEFSLIAHFSFVVDLRDFQISGNDVQCDAERPERSALTVTA